MAQSSSANTSANTAADTSANSDDEVPWWCLAHFADKPPTEEEKKAAEQGPAEIPQVLLDFWAAEDARLEAQMAESFGTIRLADDANIDTNTDAKKPRLTDANIDAHTDTPADAAASSDTAAHKKQRVQK